MKLYEFKYHYISVLSEYQPRNEEEKELKEMLIDKLYYLRAPNLVSLSRQLHQIIDKYMVSEDFKEICRQMIRDIREIKPRTRATRGRKTRNEVQ